MTRDVLVTGGAGFIGSLVVDQLLRDGATVTIFDDLSGAVPERAAALRAGADDRRGLRFIDGDIADLDAVVAAMADANEVIHLAANTDIAGGFADPRLDRDGCILGTWNVAEAMRRHGIGRIAYASSGVVYGQPDTVPTAESYGPLRPASHYAAGKLAGEAILSGFAHLYGWRALAFRFGNTVGAGSDHGVVHDFVVKLLRDPTQLEILGDGRQAKPYIAGEDVARAVLAAMDAGPDVPFDVFNVATQGTLTALEVADIVVRALGLAPDRVVLRPTATTAGAGGWRGDTPLVDFDTARLRAIGWRPAFDARTAVERAAIGTRDRLDRLGAPLLTAMERRARAAERGAAAAEARAQAADRGAPDADRGAPATPVALR